MSINILGVDYSINYTTILDLSWKGLKEIPDNVFELVNLKVLNLNHNKLTEISLNINKLVNLESLGLNYNELTEINDVSSLVKLEILNVSYNKLIEIPIDINKLVNLEYLDLEYNKIKSIPYELCEMKKLVRVDFNSNYICDDDSVKIFESLKVRDKFMADQKHQPTKMLILPMVII